MYMYICLYVDVENPNPPFVDCRLCSKQVSPWLFHTHTRTYIYIYKHTSIYIYYIHIYIYYIHIYIYKCICIYIYIHMQYTYTYTVYTYIYRYIMIQVYLWKLSDVLVHLQSALRTANWCCAKRKIRLGERPDKRVLSGWLRKPSIFG